MVIVAVRDLVFRSKIHAAAAQLGVTVQLAPRGTPLADAVRDVPGATLLVDLGEPGVVEQVAGAKQIAGVRVVGFLGHLEDGKMAAAVAAGADEVLTRGQFAARLPELLRAGAR
jgi:DNA-binding NarL/FixJ family response regulator